MKKYILIALLTGTTTCMQAQNWTGNINSDWNNPGNWSEWPLDGIDVVIDPALYTGASASPVIGTAAVFETGGILVINGASLTINHNLTAQDRVEVMGEGTSLTMGGGTLELTGTGSSARLIVGNDAAFTLNGGTLIPAQRLVVESGAIFTINNGTINAGEIAIGDGSPIGSSQFNMNGGTVNIQDELAFENEMGTYYPGFTMTAGNLNVPGNITWFGEAPGEGSPRLRISGGNTVVNGTIINLPGSIVDLYIELSGTAAFDFNGNLIDMLNATDSIIQRDNAVLTLTLNNAWNNNGVFHAENTSTFLNAQTTLTGNGKFQFHNVTVTGQVFHLGSSIFVSGDFLENGAFNPYNDTVTFNGSAPQIIGGASAGVDFAHLCIQNTSAAGITTGNDVLVRAGLQLHNGILHTSAANILMLTDSAYATQGSDSSFVSGPLQKQGNTAFVFPIGKNGKWRRLAIGAGVTTESEYTAEYFDYAHTNTTSLTAPLTAVSSVEHWTLDRTGSSDMVNVSLYWEDAMASTISSCTDLSLAQWSGSSWQNIDGTTSGSCTGNNSGYIQSNMAVPAYGIITLATKGISLSTADEISTAQINVYPNPVTSNGNLTITGLPAGGDIALTLTDASGRMVYSAGNVNQTTIELNNLDLQPGMYLVNLSRDTQRASYKLVVE